MILPAVVGWNALDLKMIVNDLDKGQTEQSFILPSQIKLTSLSSGALKIMLIR